MNNEMNNYQKKLKQNINILIENNKFEEAKELLNQYENIVKKDIDIFSIKAVMAMIEGDMENAEEILLKGLNIQAFNNDILYNLAYLYEIQEKYITAYRYYKRLNNVANDEVKIEVVDKIKELEKIDKIIEYNKRKKVLFIAHIFPPVGGSGVQRSLKFVKYLRSFGWEPVVVTVGETRYSFKDQTMLSEIPDEIEIIRIDERKNINTEYLNKLVELYSGVVKNQEIINDFINELNKSQHLKQLILQPDPYILWATEVLNQIDDRLDIRQIDRIYTTSGPYSDHIIGYYLKYKHNKPWVADFRDEWTNNPYANLNKESIFYKINYEMEKNIVNFADKVIAVTPLSSENYRNLFKLKSKKVETITNGYDEKDFIALKEKSKENKKFTIMHNGLLYSIRTPETFMKAVKQLIKNKKIDRNKIKITFGWTENIEQWIRLRNKLGLEDIVEFLDYMPHTKSLQLANEADALLLIVGPGKNNKAMYPGKIFEYLRLNKPILSLSPKGSVVDKLIDKLDAGINVDFNNIEGIKKAVLSIYHDWENGKKESITINEEVRKFERSYLTKKLASVLNEAYNEHENNPPIHYSHSKLTHQKIIEKEYMNRFGKEIDLKNPKTFNEKIQWLKLNYRDPLMIRCADKADVREYIKEKELDFILNEVYEIYNSTDEIDVTKLPNKFVLKATHGSGWNIICDNKDLLNWDVEFKKMDSWLNTNYYDLGGEWVYKKIKPRIICEKFLDEDGSPAKDYKIFCFHGEPKFIQVDVDRFSNHKQNIYDTNWEKMPFEYNYPMSTMELNKPKNFTLMIDIAKKLSYDFPFVRVDLYNVDGRIYFGELTFYPHNAKGVFKPERYDLIVGSSLDLTSLLK